MPPPTHPTPVTIYVRERGRAPTSHPTNGTLTSVAYYDMVTIPSEPVRVGAYLRIKTLREVPTPFAAPQRYVPEEPGVEGIVVSLRAMDREVVEFVVKNGVPWSTTEFAFLAAPHIPGITTRLTIIQWILYSIICLFLAGETRRIPNLPWTVVDDEKEE